MLTNLLGSKNAERVLLFLLVNESCYASEVQRAFGAPLTPIQSIMHKLEKAGVLLFDDQGKTKLCRLNPSYPLHNELKALLKTAFVHLPAHEKRVLFLCKTEWNSSKDEMKHKKRVALCLSAFWKRLAQVQSLSLQTQSTGEGFGNVTVTEERKDALIFTEKGKWVHQEMTFTNILRWSIDYSAGMVALEHLHYGPNRPVFLFHLVPTGPQSLQSIDSHLCLDDCYFGRIEFNNHRIRFLWRMLGPRKNEILNYIYT